MEAVKLMKDILTAYATDAAPFRTGIVGVVVILAVSGLAVGHQPS
jgi:hypothetical protein